MKVTSLAIPDVLLLEPDVHIDERGFFLESFNQNAFSKATGLDGTFVQDNHSRSSKGVLRGLHYQIQQPQGKLLFAVCGAVFTVAVDLRRSSGTFAKWVSVTLSEDNHHQIWIPPGFAHGFLALSASVDVYYKTTDYYSPHFERCIAWDDPTLSIPWPVQGDQPLISAKDSRGKRLADVEGSAD
jgi:dTDP-4-dehydrorhamnose 3,5-epimerase